MSAPAPALPPLPSLVVGRVHHTRHRPLRSSFTYRHHHWLIDLDAPPRLPRGLGWLARFRAEEHLDGRPGPAALKADVVARVAAAGHGRVDRVLLLAHPRSLGHVFNPMSAFWCLAADGTLRAVVLEVHNTYGGRHAYVVAPDAAGHAEVGKELYVSPFNDTHGSYAVRLRLDPGEVRVAITLSDDAGPLLSAAVWGAPQPATTGAVLRVALRHPLMTHRVSALIRVRGIGLWLRRLPVQPRHLGAHP